MISLLSTCVLINCFFFFWSLVNDASSNLKLIVFIITGFSKKEVKQMIVAGSPLLCKENGGWSSVYSSRIPLPPPKKRSY